ncbi:MAG: signal peptidase I [Candidatus Bathyarchaeia archaeon]
MATQRNKQLWKNEYFRTVVMILLIVVVVLGFWYGLRLGLNTDYPVLAVASGSMSVPQGVPDPGWAGPFSRTLHTGDLIIVEGVNPEDVYAAPFNETGRSGDILVFRAIGSDELIVHRAVGETVENGQIYFITQGDNNFGPGPYSPTPATNVIGKVVMRVPWLGYIALDMRNSIGIILIVILIIVFIVVESVISEVEHRRTEKNKNEPVERVPETGTVA